MSEMEKHRTRDSKFELLRIISMVFIIIHHYVYHGGLIFHASGSNLCLGVLLLPLGKIGVNLFVLISGYFLINSKFRIKKVINLWIKTIFFSIMIVILGALFFKNMSFANLLEAIHPLKCLRMYWFIPSYLGLYMLSPFLNKLLNSLDKNKYIYLICMFMIGLIILPQSFAFNNYVGGISWFIFLYIVGAYFKLYGIKAKYLRILMVGILLYFSWFSSVNFVKNEASFLIGQYIQMDNLIIFLLSLSIFGVFQQLKIDYHPDINFLAESTLGIYILHDNPHLRNFWWKILKTKWFYDANILVLISHIAFCAIVIYILMLMIDKIFNIVLKKTFLDIQIFDSYFEKLDNIIN